MAKKNNNKFKLVGTMGPYYNYPHWVALVKFSGSKELAEIAVVFTGSSLDPVKERGYIRFAYYPQSKHYNIPRHTWRTLERVLLNADDNKLNYYTAD